MICGAMSEGLFHVSGTRVIGRDICIHVREFNEGMFLVCRTNAYLHMPRKEYQMNWLFGSSDDSSCFATCVPSS